MLKSYIALDVGVSIMRTLYTVYLSCLTLLVSESLVQYLMADLSLGFT